jgi:dynein heavy chain
MVVPDFDLICEIMLVAEGFLDARLLARKFITLYTLCRELLSKQVGDQNTENLFFSNV